MTFAPSLMPHAVCWQQDQQLIWTMVVTNGITFLSYTTICATLFYLVRTTSRAVLKDWAFFLMGFALFIVACGSTHLLEVITTWVPVFWVDAWTNIVTAGLSAYVAVQLIRRAPELSYGINDYAMRLRNSESERARVEDSLLSARRLEEWNRMSAVVTHEINNPLSAVQNLLFLIQANPAVTPDVAAMAEQAGDEVRRIGTIARSTLGFFRQDQKPENVDLRASADSVRFLLGPMLRQRSAELVVESTGDCHVTAYAMETRQVLLNLVRNACEATTLERSTVKIVLRGRPEDVIVQVIDEGSGMTEPVLEHLFEFGVSTKGTRGNGMGLWAVKKMVDHHGGTIQVESKPGQGTRFEVCWPRQIREAAGSRSNVVVMAAAMNAGAV